MLRGKSIIEEQDTLLARGLIPIIDLAHCGTEEIPVKSVVNRVGVQLQKALSEKGMALLVNHGIAEDKLKMAWSHLDDFCDLPPDVKEHYIRKGDDNSGYVQPGMEKFDGETAELRHAFNICTINAKNLPEEPLPGFSDHVSVLATDFKALASFILQSLAVSLDTSQTFLLEKHSHMLSGDHDNETTLRLLYYPPIVEDDDKREFYKGRCSYSLQRCGSDTPDFRPEEDPRDRKAAEEELNPCGVSANGFPRMGAHIDFGTFTMLAQDSEGGLEVKLPGSEKWQCVGHLPGSILIISGEILSIWTEERYPALQHRVVIPQQEHLRTRGRHSIKFFCHPDNITMISPSDLPQNSTQGQEVKKSRKKSFKNAKEKVYNTYQLIQKKIRDSYHS